MMPSEGFEAASSMINLRSRITSAMALSMASRRLKSVRVGKWRHFVSLPLAKIIPVRCRCWYSYHCRSRARVADAFAGFVDAFARDHADAAPHMIISSKLASLIMETPI